MKVKEKKQQILDAMKFRKYFFNPKKASGSNLYFQHVFNEPEGKFEYYFHIKNSSCELKEGRTKSPLIEIITDYETWKKIGGGYLTGKKAIKEGKFKIIGGLFNFLFKYKKIFSGNINWNIPEGTYMGKTQPENKIKNVLVLSCSPRAEKGATHFIAENFIRGMKNAGAKVELLFPSKMNIKPCKGCFSCWLKKGLDCIYKDDMKIFWEKYLKSDLIVWATPLYFYHCTTAMKTLMDRLFVRSSPYILLNNGKESHPRKKEHLPDTLLIATSGFMETQIFEPLKLTIEQHTSRAGSNLLAEIIRPSVMALINSDYENIKKDQIINALEKAGEEIINDKKINKKTKKTIEQKLMNIPDYLSAIHATMDKLLEEKDLSLIQRKL